MHVRTAVRQVVPFPWRLAVSRWRHTRQWRADEKKFQLARGGSDGFGTLIAEHRSPLRRAGTTYEEALQVAKETNVTVVSNLLNGLILPAGTVFSYHHAVGPPVRRRGFVPGPELQDRILQQGVGGGACQVSNLLYVLALFAGMEIVERHRHGLDLFPDSGRTVPFGCGATVFFPNVDLRFRNPHAVPVRISLMIEQEFLVGQITGDQPLPHRYEIFELESDLRRAGDVWIRENRVGRRILTTEGDLELVEEVAHNLARCMYDPASPPND